MVTEARSMPVCARMEGFTKMMYAIVMKVVAPARISVRQLVLCSAKWNQASRRVRIGGEPSGCRDFKSGWEQNTGAAQAHILQQQVSGIVEAPLNFPLYFL